MERRALRTIVVAALVAASIGVARTAADPAGPPALFDVTRVDLAGNPLRLRLGHFDDDRFPDAAVLGVTPFPGSVDFVSVLRNNGHGRLGEHSSWLSAGRTISSIDAGNVDLATGDDVVFGSREGGFGALLNRGDGRFDDPLLGAFYGGYLHAVILDDRDDDGLLDLVIYDDDIGGWFLDTGLGNGDGTFAAFDIGYAYPASDDTELTMGDADGDGRGDIVQANEGGLVLKRGRDDGGFETGFFVGAPVVLSTEPFLDAVVADVDRDGHDDVIGTEPTRNRISVFLGDGALGFDGPHHLDANRRPSWVAVGHFDRDRHPDIAVSNAAGGNVTVIFNGPSGLGLRTETIPVGPRPGEIEAADLDHDGDDDLVLVGGEPFSVTVLLNRRVP